ncbi:MAG: hypothetical protein IMZ50_13050, partial [Candidatus Atribacteria bacterium]|nr:hypothetical protein [Candidatus Atribacteria bacterium]
GIDARALTAASVSILLLVLAFLRFDVVGAAYNLPAEWGLQYRIMLAMSLALVVIVHFVPSRRIRVAACVLRILLFLLIGYPFGRFMDTRYIAFFSVAIDLSFSLAWPVNAALSIALLLSSAVFAVPLSIFSAIQPPPHWIDLLAYFLLGSIFLSLLILIQRVMQLRIESNELITDLNEVIPRLMRANRDYLEYAARTAKESTAKERNRITMELHDVVGQAFTNIFAMMDASLKHPLVDPHEIHELHFWVREQAQKGLNDTRVALYKLRAIKERELSCIHSLSNLVNTFRLATKVTVQIEWGNLPWEIDPTLDSVLYQVVQESLINSFRHGHASKIFIHFWVDERAVLADIQDNGIGSTGGKKGIGQTTMEERAALIGGTVTVTSSEHGYSVHAEFPRRLVGEH